jgi:putative salt-induced outer membrane protein YdiY
MITKTLKTTALAALTAVALAGTALAAPSTNLWEHSIALGFTLTRGNSETLQATANWLSQRKWDKNELRFSADGGYGEDDGDQNQGYVRGVGQYNRLFGPEERFYGYIRVEGYHDAIADIVYRFVISPGVGYYFIKTAKTQFSGELGPGWVIEKKGTKEDDYFTLRVAERFEHKFNDRVRLWQSAEYLPEVGNWENYIVNAEIGIDSAMSKSLSLRAYVQDTYTSQPASGRKHNDVKLVTAIAYRF